jgi:hypothetical protein
MYTNSPSNYHYWVGATAVAATLKRHVYIQRGTWKLCPNIFTVLVGHPAIGKGESINPAMQLIRKANCANIMSDRITMEWIKSELAKGFQSFGQTSTGGISIGTDASCLLVAPELSVFLRYPEDELPDLADLWDARPEPQMYGTRSKGLVTITSPCPSMLAGCAPEWLKDAVPPSAIGGGFSRRVNFVFADKPRQTNPWPDSSDWTKVLTPLVDDLKYIGAKLHGEYKFDNLARPAFEQVFGDQYNTADLEDEATFYYGKSRWTNAAKLAMCVAASNRDDLIITKGDIEEACDSTTDIKDNLRKVFRGVGSSDIIEAGDKVVQYLENVGTASRKQIQQAVWKHCSHLELDVVLITLRDGGVIVDATVGGVTMWKAVPNNKRSMKYNTNRMNAAYSTATP